MFGACLMKDANLVGNVMREMRQSVNIPCTVKCRLGVDEFDSYEFAHNFIDQVNKISGVDHFIIHARKCLLKGLDPKQNRTVPPLRYDYVLRLKRDLPHINFSINGGFVNKQQI
jgi:tRNA-dihydrouridine synthase A